MNNTILSGRIAADATINANNTRVAFTLIHNFGGDRGTISVNVYGFKNRKGEWPVDPATLTKGKAFIVTAFMRPNNYTDNDGNKKYRVQYILKSAVPMGENNKSTNDLALNGRLAADPVVSENGKAMSFRIIHNFGGEKLQPLGLNLVAFTDKNGKWPAGVESLKKGDAVLVKAFQRPNSFTSNSGDVITRTQYVVKSVEPVVKDSAETPEEAAAESEATEA